MTRTRLISCRRNSHAVPTASADPPLCAMQDQLIENLRVADRKLRRLRRTNGANKGIVPVFILTG